MAAPNIQPIYTKTPDVSNNKGTGLGGTILTAVADFTGVSGNYVLVHTADTQGSYVRKLRFKAIGTNVTTVVRVFLNNGSTNGTATNNIFYGEVSLPATTSSNNALTGPDIDYVMDIALPAGWRIYAGTGTTVASGWICTAVTGQY